MNASVYPCDGMSAQHAGSICTPSLDCVCNTELFGSTLQVLQVLWSTYFIYINWLRCLTY